jgi:hypothetical protein
MQSQVPSLYAVHPFSASAGLPASLTLELHDPSSASIFAARSAHATPASWRAVLALTSRAALLQLV